MPDIQDEHKPCSTQGVVVFFVFVDVVNIDLSESGAVTTMIARSTSAPGRSLLAGASHLAAAAEINGVLK